ncbi:MAG: S41 family peptidase, partial [Deltaproteobacteria bacterium]
MLFESDEVVLKAYHKNVSQLLRDKVEQKYFENFPEGRGLLAKALLGGLDPYSTYFSSREFTDFYEELKGTSAGLGLQLEKVPQGFLVQKVVENSPAAKSNRVHEGDIIESVDEVNLSSLAFEEAKKLLKGPENSTVRIGLECVHGNSKEGVSEQVEVSLQRGQFELEETKINLSWKMPPVSEPASQKVAVISIPAFYGRGGMESGKEEKSVSEDLKKRMTDELMNESSHLGMVLDLRGNPGGYLEEAVTMGSLCVGD